MAGRQTRGRQRIPMRLIQSQDDLYATFSKRRLGLYKKASELSTLCGVDIGVIIFSPTNNPYSFFHPSMESVVERYRNPDQPPNDLARIVEGHTRTRIEQLNKRLDEVLDMKDQIKEREKYLDEVDKTRPKGWWEQPVESLNAQQVKEWKAWFGELHARVTSRIEELTNGGSGSLENAPIFPDPPSSVPSMFPQNYVPSAGTSSAPPGDGIGEADQFSGQYYYAPPQGQDPFFVGPNQFYDPPQGQDPSDSGTNQYYILSGAPDPSGTGPSQYYGPPLVQNPSGAGPSEYYGPPLVQNPSGTGPSQYYGPQPNQDPPTAGSSKYYGPPQAQDPSGTGPNQFYGPPPVQDPSCTGPNQYYGPPPTLDPSVFGLIQFYGFQQGQDPSDIGPSQFNVPPSTKDPPGVGPTQFYGRPPGQDQFGTAPSQFYRPPLGQNPSGVGPRRLYNAQQGWDPSAAGGNGEAGTSNQGGQ
ncbi:UNVERIFIED_CONTAM: Agamous-like MADS-box protein [Sesamum latifolium]|uniref:Agamous-like MADS-box protein n=1 Tax=Sesamum latifolium TaxID=2727402 RepID=A0AAW2SPC6_9LAMI